MGSCDGPCAVVLDVQETISSTSSSVTSSKTSDPTQSCIGQQARSTPATGGTATRALLRGEVSSEGSSGDATRLLGATTGPQRGSDDEARVVDFQLTSSRRP